MVHHDHPIQYDSKRDRALIEKRMINMMEKMVQTVHTLTEIKPFLYRFKRFFDNLPQVTPQQMYTMLFKSKSG